jgi:hypothetical protein
MGGFLFSDIVRFNPHFVRAKHSSDYNACEAD